MKLTERRPLNCSPTRPSGTLPGKILPRNFLRKNIIIVNHSSWTNFRWSLIPLDFFLAIHNPPPKAHPESNLWGSSEVAPTIGGGLRPMVIMLNPQAISHLLFTFSKENGQPNSSWILRSLRDMLINWLHFCPLKHRHQLLPRAGETAETPFNSHELPRNAAKIREIFQTMGLGRTRVWQTWSTAPKPH